MAVLRDGDYMKTLIEYVKRNLSKGYSHDQIRLVLLQQGYSRAAIDRAIRLVQESMPKQAPVLVKERPKIEVVSHELEKKPGFFEKLFGKKKKKEEQTKIDNQGNITSNF